MIKNNKKRKSVSFWEARNDALNIGIMDQFDRRYSPWWIVEGKVNESKEHIKLTFGIIADTQILVACLAKGTKKRFIVQFKSTYTAHTLFGDKEERIGEDIIRAVKNELHIYLIESREQYPWDYAIYHCGTAANLYSTVHWTYYPLKIKSGKQASRKKTIQIRSKQKTAIQHKKPATHTSSGSRILTPKGKALLSKRRAG